MGSNNPPEEEAVAAIFVLLALFIGSLLIIATLVFKNYDARTLQQKLKWAEEVCGTLGVDTIDLYRQQTKCNNGREIEE